jgi:hypothetical protein
MSNDKAWQLGSSTWEQHDEKQQFFLSGHHGKTLAPQPRPALDMVIGAKLHRSASGKACNAGFLPKEFAFCPYCGSPVSGPSTDEDNLWIAPYGGSDGTRVVAASGFSPSALGDKATIASTAELAMPRSAGLYAFVVARLNMDRRMLLAIDRSCGRLDLYDAREKKWIPLRRQGDPVGDCSRQPSWSWSVAVHEEPGCAGICWPSEQGAVWAEVDALNQVYTVTLGSGRSAGGAAAHGRQVLVPTEMGGQLGLSRYDIDQKKWEFLPLPHAFHVPGSWLGIPTIDVSRQKIYWITSHGCVSCDVSGDTPQVTWRAWENPPQSARALPEYGPPYIDRKNHFWQLCLHTGKEETYRYYEITGNGTERQDDISGAMFSTGQVSFDRKHTYWEEPWNSRRSEEQSNIRLPLLQFGDAENSTVVALSFHSELMVASEVFDHAAGYVNREAMAVQIVLESRNDQSRTLQLPTVISTKRPWECNAFLFDNHLHVYIPEKLKCFRWQLA